MSALQRSKLSVWALMKELTGPLILRLKKIVDGMDFTLKDTRMEKVLEHLNGLEIRS